PSDVCLFRQLPSLLEPAVEAVHGDVVADGDDDVRERTNAPDVLLPLSEPTAGPFLLHEGEPEYTIVLFVVLLEVLVHAERERHEERPFRRAVRDRRVPPEHREAFSRGKDRRRVVAPRLRRG